MCLDQAAESTASLRAGVLAVAGQFFAGGQWHDARGACFEVLNPATEEVVGVVRAADDVDVDVAVTGASQAFPGWSRTPLAERLKLLTKVCNLLLRDRVPLAHLITEEMGMPLTQSPATQVGWCANAIDDVIATAGDALHDEMVGGSVVRRLPLGVAACITPWNFPVHQVVGKVAEALAAGCTVVVKASEMAPLSPLRLAQYFTEAGTPPGVFNLVSGGPETGQALTSHPQVSVISFTGSSRAGVTVAASGAQNLAKVSLELGGKAPSIVLDQDVVFRATAATLANCYFNAGQVCTALSRLIVPRSQLGRVVAKAEALLGDYVAGNPLSPQTTTGPLISGRQRDMVRDVLDACSTSVDILSAAPAPERGYFVTPTVVVDAAPDSALVTTELFAPVLVIQTHDGPGHAVELANGVPYGLNARVWGTDADAARHVAERIRAGQVAINDSPFDGRAPFGGFRMSGLGRAHGGYGVREYTETQALPAPASTFGD